MSEITFETIQCIDCGTEEKNVTIYNHYEKTEAQIRNGYRCRECNNSRKDKYRNRRRY